MIDSCRQTSYLQLWLLGAEQSRNPQSCSSRRLSAPTFVHMRQGFVPHITNSRKEQQARASSMHCVHWCTSYSVVMEKQISTATERRTHPELWLYVCGLWGGVERMSICPASAGPVMMTLKQRRNDADWLFFFSCCRLHCILSILNNVLPFCSLLKFSFSISTRVWHAELCLIWMSTDPNKTALFLAVATKNIYCVHVWL